MSTTIIEAQGLGKRFGSNWVIRNMDLAVPEGSVYGLLGRNGAGKTTTIRMMFGLLRANRGQVSVAGAVPYRDPVKLRRAVGYAGDDLGLYPRWTVERVLRFASRVYEDWDSERADNYVRKFGLPLRTKVNALSSGMKARLILTLALVRRPKVLLLDEPFGGLDVVVRRDVLEGLIDILPGSGSTVFVASHLVHELERIVDHVGIMQGGRINFTGTLDHLRASVRKVRLTWQGEEKRPKANPNICRVERWGRGWDLTIVRYEERLLNLLKGEGFTVEDVHTLPLEDIAYEYLRENDDAEEVA